MTGNLLDLVARYERRRVPRYTSYPTAPHFTPAVGAAAYRDWLAATGPGETLSLYLHVPFCRELCWYCGCHTKITRRDEPIARYLAALRREVGLVADLLPSGMRVRQVHWGGGTPTTAGPDGFRAVMDLIRRRFDVAADAEIAVELDPRVVDATMVDALAAAGVDRASLGVQTFEPAVQRAINRIQDPERTQAVAAALRRAGIGRLNVDLMYGLPHQSEVGCRRTVERVLELRPARVAVFGYAHLPRLKRHQRLIDDAALPGGPERWRQFAAIAGALTAAGYGAIGLDHFARPDDGMAVALREGRLRRNFQGYTTDPADALIGFGASAIGALRPGYVQNATAIAEYERAIAAGRLATRRGLALSGADRLRREVIERLMCDLAVDLDAVADRHGVGPGTFAPELRALAPLAADGLVRVERSRVAVPEHARPLVRSVAAVFDAYLADDGAGGGGTAGRHATAV